jgi:hypothetical protein
VRAALPVLALAAIAIASAQPPVVLPHQVTPWDPSAIPAPSSSGTVVGFSSPGALSSTNWTFIGPAPLSISVVGGNPASNVSGRITGVAADPTDSNTIYISSAGGGVWKTINGGSTWLPLTDAQSTLSMGAIAVAASNHNVVYAGTGEANNSGDSNFGRGILVSVDGGATWTLQTGPAGVFNTRRLTTSRIAIDPTNPNIAYAAMADFGNNGLYGTNTGIWKTTDGGATWANTTQAAALNSSDPWSDVAINPLSPLTVYAALGRYDGIAANGVYKSTNGGATWSLISGFQHGTTAGRITLAIAKSNPQVVYVAAQNTSTFGLLSLIRSDDGGGSLFTTVSPPNYMGSQGWYDQWIAVDPSNSAIVYVAGAAGTNSILRSTTSGAAWTDIHIGSGGTSPHVDHHGVDFDPTGKLIEGNDGGIYRLADPTTPVWNDLNGNLGTIQFQGIGLHPTDPTKALAGSQDNGTELYNNDLIWTEVDGGDGGWVKYSRTNTNRVYRISPVASFGSTAFFRRSDSGGTGGTWVNKTSGLTNTSTFNFYAPFVVDPGNGDRLLTGGDRVFESTNGADLWTAISTPNVNGWIGSSSIDAIALAASNLATVYAAAGIHLFVTTNHGASWADHPLPVGGTVADLQVDPANASTAYAVVSAFTTGGNVFKTINGGTTWTNISGNLPNEPVWSIQLDAAAGALYAGADDGVYESNNGGATWTRKGAALPNAQVLQLDFNPTTDILAAATHGRGAWEILTPPTVLGFRVLFGSQNFNLLTSTRTRLPWQVTGIQVVFSRTITSASTASIAGVNATAISGLGTNTITWTIDPLTNTTTIVSLLGTGVNAITDSAGTAIATFNQNVKVLWGDYNDDGVVNSQDLVGVNGQRSAPYNIFADIDGNGVVDANDVNVVRSRVGTSNP